MMTKYNAGTVTMSRRIGKKNLEVLCQQVKIIPHVTGVSANVGTVIISQKQVVQ